MSEEKDIHLVSSMEMVEKGENPSTNSSSQDSFPHIFLPISLNNSNSQEIQSKLPKTSSIDFPLEQNDEWKNEILQINECLPVHDQDEEEHFDFSISPNILSDETIFDSNNFSKHTGIHNYFEMNPQKLSTLLNNPLTDEEIEQLTFDETLIINYLPDSEENLDPVCPCCVFSIDELFRFASNQIIGGCCIMVKLTGGNLVTTIASQFIHDDISGTNTIYSIADRNLRVIEHRKTEKCSSELEENEKTLHLAEVNRESNNFVAFRSETSKNDNRFFRGQIKMDDRDDLILDGTSILVMRYIVQHKIKGCYDGVTVNISGEICPVRYSSVSFTINNRQDQPMDLFLIQRICYIRPEETDISVNIFLPTGRLIKHFWYRCPYMMHCNPMIFDIPDIADNLMSESRDDLDMLRTFLDAANIKCKNLRSSFCESEIFRDIIKKYLFHLLQNKPLDVLKYTIDYFSK